MCFSVWNLTETLSLIFPPTCERIINLFSKYPFALDNLLFQLLIFFFFLRGSPLDFSVLILRGLNALEVWCTYVIWGYPSLLSWEFPSCITSSEVFCLLDSVNPLFWFGTLFWWRNTYSSFLRSMEIKIFLYLYQSSILKIRLHIFISLPFFYFLNEISSNLSSKLVKYFFSVFVLLILKRSSFPYVCLMWCLAPIFGCNNHSSLYEEWN